MMTDVRFAFRQLFKSPAFTFLAVLTLALGIGLNTAIFSLINDLFLRGLPFQQPTRLLHVFSHSRNRRSISHFPHRVSCISAMGKPFSTDLLVRMVSPPR